MWLNIRINLYFVPAVPWSLALIEAAGAMFLTDVELGPGAALLMPVRMPLSRGFCRPDVGSLDPEVSRESKRWRVSKNYQNRITFSLDAEYSHPII